MLPLGSKQGFRLVPAWLGAALQEESWGCWQRQAEHKPAACPCCRGSQMRGNGQTPETREPQGIRDKLEGVEQIAHRGCKASILTAFPLGSITPKSKAFTSLYFILYHFCTVEMGTETFYLSVCSPMTMEA